MNQSMPNPILRLLAHPFRVFECTKHGVFDFETPPEDSSQLCIEVTEQLNQNTCHQKLIGNFMEHKYGICFIVACSRSRFALVLLDSDFRAQSASSLVVSPPLQPVVQHCLIHK